MAIDYAAAGLSSILDSVFHDDAILNEVCEILRRGNVDHYIFSLHSPLDEVLTRNSNRDDFYRQSDENVKAIYNDFDWVGTVIETQNKVEEEVVSEILEKLELLRLHSSNNCPGISYPLNGQEDAEKVCVFLRHGSCDLDAERYQLPEDVGLSSHGRAEMTATASTLCNFNADRLVVSPFRRARESADIVAALTGVTPEVEQGLSERYFESLGSQKYDELRRIHNDDFVDRLLSKSETIDIDGEETLEQACQRVLSTMRSIIHRSTKRTIVVSHGGPHSWLLRSYIGTSLDRNLGIGLSPSHFTVFTYRANGDFSSVLGINLASWDESILG
jgi:broad specificity phosphatase PhoE